MRTFLTLTCLLFFATLSQAQNVPPAMLVQLDGEKSTPIGLEKYGVDIKIDGFLAKTTATMVFYNPHERILAGTLYFPLPEGSTVLGYALDVNGQLVEGVAVTKKKARVALETEMRRGVDPGIVEWTKGNNFKTRVFPLPAKGRRTIQVTYITELFGGKKEPTYFLPMQFKQVLPEFKIRVEVVRPDEKPRVAKGGLSNFAFKEWKSNYVAETTEKNFIPNEDLYIALPRVPGKNRSIVQKTETGDYYFVWKDDALAEKFHAAATSEKASGNTPPKRVVIFWDASGSRAGKHTNELLLLEKALAAWKNCELTLIFLRDKATVALTTTDQAKILERCKRVQYDGATNLATMKLPTDKKYDFALLFSDGLTNYGQSTDKKLGVPLHTFTDSTSADYPLLRGLALKTGGNFRSLVGLDAEKVGAAVMSLLSNQSVVVPKVEVLEGKVEDVLPTVPISPFTVTGKLLSSTATLQLTYTRGDNKEVRTLKLSQEQATLGNLTEKFWAQKKLAELLLNPEEKEYQIRQLGQRYAMVTPETSLIVLETLAQYIEHEICPPNSLPEMKKQYLARVEQAHLNDRKTEEQRIENVVRQWKERVAWHEKEFKYPKNFKFGIPVEKKLLEGVGGLLKDAFEMGLGEQKFSMDASEAPEEAPEMEPMAPPAARIAAPEEQTNGDIAGSNAEGKEDEEEKPGQITREDDSKIKLKKWDPQTPYVILLKKTAAEQRHTVYYQERGDYAGSPAFYLDCAGYFWSIKDKSFAIQVLSNLAELELENPQILRVLGHRLAQWNQLDAAISVFEEVLKMREEEPQSYRDLALVLARKARAKKDGEMLTRSIELLYNVVTGDWDGRFPGIQVIVLEEIGALLPLAKVLKVEKKLPKMDKRLLKTLESDIRIVMTWHADNTDIDLWVIEPSNERASYEHNRTTIGGRVSNDLTGGYGPEQYTVRRAMPGKYEVKAHYYGSNSVELLGNTAVQLDIFTNFGRPNEKRQSLTVQLAGRDDLYDVGEIEWKGEHQGGDDQASAGIGRQAWWLGGAVLLVSAVLLVRRRKQTIA